MEGGPAEAVADTAAQPPSEPQAGRAEASPQTGVCPGCIEICVSSGLPTSRATRLAEAIVVVVDAPATSYLRLRLAIISRLDLLLWKHMRACT